MFLLNVRDNVSRPYKAMDYITNYELNACTNTPFCVCPVAPLPDAA